MKPNYKVVYTAANGKKVESLFRSFQRATEFAKMMDGIVLNNKEA